MSAPNLPSARETVRVDVWLWAVRQCKTRSLATSECRAGHVRVNGEPAKAALKIRPGDEIRYRVEGWDRILRVKACIAKRVGAPVAAQCYEDLTPERERVAVPIVFKRERGAGRPTKKERRELDRLRGRDGNFGRRDN